jgi:hypothetical protein
VTRRRQRLQSNTAGHGCVGYSAIPDYDLHKRVPTIGGWAKQGESVFPADERKDTQNARAGD